MHRTHAGRDDRGRRTGETAPVPSAWTVLRVALAAVVATTAFIGLLGRAGALPLTAGAATTGSTAAVVTKSETDPAAQAQAKNELTLPKAVILGVVEGVTEFLPISSTGHLLITERLLDVGTSAATKDAADTYTVAIQAGAILAVLLLYRKRLWSMVEGAIGRDPVGRRTLFAVIIAFAPAAVVGVLFEKKIKEHLLEPWPVVIAWIVGGVLLLVFARRWDERHEGSALEQITYTQAGIIGLAQVLAMWPGTSRSLVTIVAALAVGLSLPAAVEFSFVLGFVTLGAATAYELAKNGKEMFATYGVLSPTVGLVVAFLSAAAAITWMVGYLQKHSLALFGWYRIGVALLAAALLVTGVI